MSVFDLFRKKTVSNPMPATPAEHTAGEREDDEFVVATLVPRKIPMTADMMRRQREEELRKKYCTSSVQTGAVI